MSTGADARVTRARTVAMLLDSALAVPGTRWRIGLDPLLGLVPGLGDLAGAVMSGHIVLLAPRLGAPANVVARMIGTVVLDTLLGAVPVDHRPPQGHRRRAALRPRDGGPVRPGARPCR